MAPWLVRCWLNSSPPTSLSFSLRIARDATILIQRKVTWILGLGPDEELLHLASAGQLSDPKVLRQQTDRLFEAVRSETFIDEFTDQWLMLHELESTTPDGKLHPEYDDILHHSLLEESQAFFHELIARNLPAINVVDSNVTFLNSRLARHYKIARPEARG